MLGHVAQVGEDLLAHAFVEGTDGADHFHFIRNDVVADAAVDRAEGQHRRLLGQVGAAADDGLRGADQIGGGHDRVHSIPRCRTVRLAADHLDPEAVRGGHQRATTHCDLPCLHAGEHMQAEHRLRLEVGDPSFLQHQCRTALFRWRCAFLGRLEDQHHLARQVLLHRHQRFGHAEQGGGVRIMAAGMHHAHGLAAVLVCGLGGERQAGLLGHRQRIHVRAQRDLRARLAAFDDRHHAVMGDAGLRLQAHRTQALGDLGRGARLAVGQLRMLVELAAPFNHPGLQPLCGGGHFRALPVLGMGKRRQGQQQGGQQQRTAHRNLHGKGFQLNVGQHCRHGNLRGWIRS
ncbi:hypothetical protein G6F68_010232 [Rhizopus microsporus]|nr:hypothetical protein G6F68_010232 [Rhizopus microsporus]